MGGMFSGRKYWEISTRKKRFTCELSSIDSLQVYKVLTQIGKNLNLDTDIDIKNFGRWNMFQLSFKEIEGRRIVYFVGYNKHEGQSFSSQLDFTDCFYGGQRCWFKCYYCEKRVRFLHFEYSPTFSTLACRSCHDLTYRSQNRSFSDRILDKRRKIAKKLGQSGIGDSWARKPKGMHTSTYFKLLDQDSELDTDTFRAFLFKIKNYKALDKCSFKSLNDLPNKKEKKRWSKFINI